MAATQNEIEKGGTKAAEVSSPPPQEEKDRSVQGFVNGASTTQGFIRGWG